MGSSSMDTVISFCRSLDFASKQLTGEILRVLKPGGKIIVYHSQSAMGEADNVINLQHIT